MSDLEHNILWQKIGYAILGLDRVKQARATPRPFALSCRPTSHAPGLRLALARRDALKPHVGRAKPALPAILSEGVAIGAERAEKGVYGADCVETTETMLTKREQHAYNVIEQAVQEYKLDAVYVLLSGGHDSLTAAWIASQHPKFAGVIHAETRTGYIANEVTKFVEKVCKQYDWHLIKKHPATSYLMLVSDFGFPGAARHMFMYRYLKERPIAAAKKEAMARSGKKIGFVTGMRRQESMARSETEPFHKVKSDYFIAAIYDWSKQECEDLLKRRSIPTNPIKLALGISGECGCGSHAAKSERKLSELLFTEQGRWLKALEKVVQATYDFQQLEVEQGIRQPDKAIRQEWLRWGNGRSVASEQQMMPGFALCNGCVNKAAENGENGDDPDMMLRVAMLERREAHRPTAGESAERESTEKAREDKVRR